MTDWLTNLFGPRDGAEIPGGCDTCDAYQTIGIVNGVAHITVRHDDWCPTLKRATRKPS